MSSSSRSIELNSVNNFSRDELKPVTKHDEDVFVDSSAAKIDIEQDAEKAHSVLNRQFNLDAEVAQLNELGDSFKQERSLWRRICSLDLGFEFEDKRYMVYMLGAFASAAGILSGIDQSIISGASIGMNKALHLSAHEASMVSSLMPLGAMAGSVIMSPLNEWFGRKSSIMISCIWYTVGAILCAASTSHHLMYAGRFILGVGVGIEGGCVGIYVSESVPSTVRGNLVSMYQFNIALGELFGYIVGVIFFDVHGGWRFMVGSSLVFSTILLVGMFFLPESPRWLVHKGRIGEGWNVWKRLRDVKHDNNNLEFLEMRHAAAQDKELRANESRFQAWFDLIRIPRNRRALVYAVMMVSLGQLTGINAIMYYMSTLMGQIGFSEKRSVAMSMVGGAALLLGTIPAILYMDRFGRRTWANTIVLFTLGLVLVGVGYQINRETNLPAAEGVYLTGQILYNMAFGSYSALTWVLPSESFSLATRSVGMTVCSTMLYLWSWTVTYNFDRMQKAMTYTGLTLGFYGGIAIVIGIPYQLLFMPETKNKTLEEIDDIFSRPTIDIVRENAANVKRNFARVFRR
ncbi:Fructose symporter [Lachancea thermotolerans]|uniref:KLTH0G11154p n=1 Tax=Lachancea thermotolerans (strain ATCC 56472 / CBS 6340 / NRRL Y-8284) TaxID=559295 RepID=C5DMS0_LACTC|nr:KLTH0G11154p [Lachancea thermotolerans CBS 6340]CAR25081.1 KLTH0G11154p [Lachancea thermotolerans CBS 6340]